MTRPKVFVKVIHFNRRLISEKSFTVIFPLSPGIEFLNLEQTVGSNGLNLKLV